METKNGTTGGVMKKVFFIGDNIISSLGFTASGNFEQLKNGVTGIKRITNPELYPEPFIASMVNRNKLQTLFPDNRYTLLEKMLILSVEDAIKNTGVDISSSKTLIVLSTTKGNIDLLDESLAAKYEKNRVYLWKLGDTIAAYFRNPNKPLVISNACISGVMAINTAAMLLQNDLFENIIITGGDIVSRFVLSGFMSFHSLSPEPCKPFDANRDGLSLGEAAGTVVMSVRPGKHKKSFVFAGGATANDANHISGPSRTGEGSYIAIKKALQEAGINPHETDHISAHGTATPYNDDMESIALSRHNMNNIPVNSLKGFWGHTLGAAGIIETIALLHEMKNNILIQTKGFSKAGTVEPLNVITQTEKTELNTCLKMASGFGGCNAALIVKKQMDD
jgi:3-oxoacyl-[acyl-carrier-protein] synthase-1